MTTSSIVDPFEQRQSSSIVDPLESQAPSPRSREIPSAAQPKEAQYDLLGGAKEVGKAGIAGTVAGAFTPEIIKGVGYGMKAFPPLQPFSPSVIAAGQAMKGAGVRAKGAVAGGIGGTVGETAGQAVEAYGGTPTQAEAARFVGGMAGPEALFQLTRPFTAAGGYGLSLLANKMGFPIGTTARTIGQMLEEKGVQEANLTQRQREFVQQKIQEIRGGAETTQPMKDIMGMLQAGAQQIMRNADMQAQGLEKEAQKLIADAQFAGGRISQETEQRISRLQSQFEQASERIKKSAESQGRLAVEQAEAAANQIRQIAAAKAPEVRAAAIKQADDLIAAGRKQADELTARAKQQVKRLQEARDRFTSSIPARREVAQREVGAVGERVTPTELGGKLRKAFNDVFAKLKQTREENVKKYKDEAFSAALKKEQDGERYQGGENFKSIIQEITDEIVDPSTGLARAIPEQREQLTKIRDLLRRGIGRKDPETDQMIYQPLSFNGLEQLRRQLRDRASGLPAEGYDAINQQQAGRLAERVERIMEEFSPGLRKYIDQYRADSEPLNQFKNKLGKAMVGKEEFDFSEFVTDPSKLSDAAFSSASTVRQLVNTVGQQPSEEFARSFIADRIRGGTAKDVAKALDDSRDWISLFTNLERQLQDTARRVGVEERVIGKRTSLAKALRTEMGKFPERFGQMGTAARRAEETGMTEAQRAISRGETEAENIARQAETQAAAAAQKGISEEAKILGSAEQQRLASSKAIERQKGKLEEEAAKQRAAKLKEAETAAGTITKEAAGLRSEAQKKADIVLGGQTPVDRVQNFLLGAKADEWAEISPIIKATPGGREKLAEAVSQVIASRAERSLKGALADMKLMRERLVDNGLMSRADADKIVDRLQEIFVTPIAEQAKISMAQRLVRNAIAGYAAPGVERGVTALMR